MPKPPKSTLVGPTPDLLDLTVLARLPRNAKTHDQPAIEASLKAFGFVQRLLVNTVTGHLLSGHGRLDALLALKQLGAPRPKGIGGEGQTWLVPVDQLTIPANREEAVALALNKVQERGGWDEEILQAVLKDLDAADALAGTGFTDEDLTVADPTPMKPIELNLPTMAWVLIGIPLADYPQIAPIVEALALIPTCDVETTCGN